MFIILKSFGAGMGRLIILIWLGLSDNLLDLISLTWRCKCRWKCNLWTCFDFLLLVFSILSSETSESVSCSSNRTKSTVSKNNFVFSSIFWQEKVKDDEKLIVNYLIAIFKTGKVWTWWWIRQRCQLFDSVTSNWPNVSRIICK